MCEHKIWTLLALLVLSGGAQASKGSKRPPGRARGCSERPEELLEQMYGRLAAGMLSAFHHTLQLEPRDKQNVSCPAGGRAAPDKKQRMPINLLSVAPWSYRISYDPSRYPKYIPEAYCLCKGCLTGIFGEENLYFRSTPVYMPTVVLRRTTSCAGGRYIYVEDYITIPVGCTCVPEQDRDNEPDSVNSSIGKEEKKFQVKKSDKPASE
ncbi:interleukin-17D [Rhinatrema bivittatum]|uniref:interleukin-17D n=1 Tax=Rhinatrema bivittatum TaxID=194408 RepID=UPI001125BAFB|nr:interleukin-17D [Rhinatrema bivittatum]